MNTQPILHHSNDPSAWHTTRINDLQHCITPVETETYTPISHHIFANHILGNLDANIEQANFMLTNNNQRMFAHIILKDQLWFGKNTTLIMRNSHDKSVAAFVGGGSYTFLCTNLAAHAQYSINVRHVGDAWERIKQQLPGLFDQLTLAHKGAQQRFERMSKLQLSYSAGESIIIQAARQEIIPASKIVQVANEFRYPSFDYDHVSHQSLGYLYESFTSTALHDITPQRNTNKTLELNSLMDNVLEAA